MSIFPTKILLATDGSEEAELAALRAVDLADATDSELHVVHVGVVPIFLKSYPGTLGYERRLYEQIEEVSKELQADLIVMGSRGLGGVRRALMGSVSDSVVRHAHCPVLVVRPEKERAA